MKTPSALLLLLFYMIGAPVAAQPSVAAGEVKALASGIAWNRVPSAAEKAKNFLRHQTGAYEARLSCKVGERGRLKECKAGYTGPEGLDIQTAALALITYYAVEPKNKAGEQLQGRTVTVLLAVNDGRRSRCLPGRCDILFGGIPTPPPAMHKP